MAGMAASTASADPKRRSPASGKSPRSAHSMAQARVPPVLMLSRPYASQRRAASSTASGSSMPHRGPRAKSVSYSMRCSFPDCDLNSLSQRMVQEAHPCRRLKLFSVRLSPLRPSAPAKVGCWKLRVGSAPSRSNTARFATVPISRYLAVCSPRLRCRRVAAIAATPSASATETLALPDNAMAFRFLEPMTAPTPPRPACRPSLLMVAKRTRFSPAVPTEATLAVGLPSSARTAVSVSAALPPHRWRASRSSTPRLSMNRYTGAAARPVTTTASTPTALSSSAKKLDESESAMKPVRGDFVTTAYLAVVVRPVPANGALAKIRGFSGARGSTPGGAKS